MSELQQKLAQARDKSDVDSAVFEGSDYQARNAHVDLAFRKTIAFRSGWAKEPKAAGRVDEFSPEISRKSSKSSTLRCETQDVCTQTSTSIALSTSSSPPLAKSERLTQDAETQTEQVPEHLTREREKLPRNGEETELLREEASLQDLEREKKEMKALLSESTSMHALLLQQLAEVKQENEVLKLELKKDGVSQIAKKTMAQLEALEAEKRVLAEVKQESELLNLDLRKDGVSQIPKISMAQLEASEAEKHVPLTSKLSLISTTASLLWTPRSELSESKSFTKENTKRVWVPARLR